MKHYSLIGKASTDFSLTDTHDKPVNLSDYRNKRIVVLVFNRGFA